MDMIRAMITLKCGWWPERALSSCLAREEIAVVYTSKSESDSSLGLPAAGKLGMTVPLNSNPFVDRWHR